MSIKSLSKEKGKTRSDPFERISLIAIQIPGVWLVYIARRGKRLNSSITMSDGADH